MMILVFFYETNLKFPTLKYESWVANIPKPRYKNIDLENYSLSIFNDKFKIKTKLFFIRLIDGCMLKQIEHIIHYQEKWINSKDNKIFLTGDWVLGKSLSDDGTPDCNCLII